MARTKPNILHIPLQRQRTSWTKFYLPREQDWPTWAPPTTAGSIPKDDAPRSSLGPLAGAAGCVKVWLGRQVEDPEQAVFVVGKYSSLSFPITLLVTRKKSSLGVRGHAEGLPSLPRRCRVPAGPACASLTPLRSHDDARLHHEMDRRVSLRARSLWPGDPHDSQLQQQHHHHQQ